jgi:hypothetical protein
VASFGRAAPPYGASEYRVKAALRSVAADEQTRHVRTIGASPKVFCAAPKSGPSR